MELSHVEDVGWIPLIAGSIFWIMDRKGYRLFEV